MEQKEDNYLLFRYIQSGDSKGIELVYKQFFPGIRYFVTRNNGTEQDALDVFHDAIMAVYLKSKDDNFQLTSSFYTFFYTICRNLWYKQLRKNSRDRGTIIEDMVYTDEDSIDNLLIDFEKESLFWEKFKLLQEDCRKLLSLFFEGHSMEKITSIMGLSSANYAKKKKFKCKEKLVSLIEDDRRYNELKND